MHPKTCPTNSLAESKAKVSAESGHAAG